MGTLRCFNGALKYAASFKLCPLEDVLLECFINFFTINNQHLCREILFQEKLSNKIVSHEIKGVIAYSRV